MTLTTTDDPTSSRLPSHTAPESSIEFIVPILPSKPAPCPSRACNSPSTQDVQEPMTYDQIFKACAKKEALQRHAKHRLRLEARLGTAGLAIRDENRLKRLELNKAGRDLVRKTCTKREQSKFNRELALPKTFETLDVVAACGMKQDQVMFENGRIIQREHIRAEDSVFIGLVKIDDRLSAMRQALSEHTKDGSWGKGPGRYSFHADAAVSAHSHAGIGVVYQPRQRDWPSPWIAKGYRIAGINDRNDAESWAIWHVLQMIIEKAGADRAHIKSRDPPCSLVVIYSNFTFALKAILNREPRNSLVIHKIIKQSIRLQGLGVSIELHWCPGQGGVPGNELADAASKRAQASTD